MAGNDLTLNATSSMPPRQLHEIASKGQIDTLQKLLDSGIPIDALNAQNKTALNVAIDAGQVDAIKTLIQRGANPNHPDDNGIPLHRVATKELILTNAQHVNMIRSAAASMMESAINIRKEGIRNALEIIKMLLRHGADVNRKNCGNKTAIEAAKDQRHSNREIIILLEKASSAYTARLMIFPTDQKTKTLALYNDPNMKYHLPKSIDDVVCSLLLCHTRLTSGVHPRKTHALPPEMLLRALSFICFSLSPQSYKVKAPLSIAFFYKSLVQPPMERMLEKPSKP